MKTSLSRRGLIGSGMVAIGTFATPRLLSARSGSETLAEAGRAVGIDVGSAIRTDAQRDVARLIGRECDIITPESALKPDTVSPGQGRFRWSEAERTYAFARANGLRVHGHTLFWHKHPLKWAAGGSRGKSLDDVAGLYGGYIDAVMKHFPATVSWDVFNEITGTRALLRETFPISEFGIDFIERLLRAARAAAPDARLAINENDLECSDRDCRSKRAHALKILRELRKRGAPLDAFGIQAHLSSRHTPSGSATLGFIRDVEDLGLDVFLSEMDVNDVDFARDYRRRDEQVADMYGEFLGTVLQSRAVKRVIFWGITDSANWIADGEAAVRSDGARQRPALFDRDLEPKPAYYAVREALRAAPKR